jgi:hypothetical protein
MIHRTRRLLALTLAVLVTASTLAFAQGSATSSISGVVSDTGGGVIPGATVVVTNMATGVASETATTATGAFNVPALSAGTYSVTVSLTGFKTAVISDIRLVTNSPATVQVKLEVGELTETIEVAGGSTLVQTTSTAVTSTIAVEQLQDLPLVSRNALYSIAFLPGVETAGGPRGSVISGLPNNTVNITIDGVSTGNAFMSTDGFFSMITPRLDAVEEITVTGATPGAGGGSGAVQIAFTTRAGTNEFNSSIYHTIRDPKLNSNYYFNKINGLEKNDVRMHTYGGRIGGPIVIPGLYDGRNKAFFFFNMEHQYQPSEATRTRTILNPEAQAGVFSYFQTVGGVQTLRQVNLYDLAAATGNTATPDPFLADLLTRIRQSTTTTGSVTTPLGATNTENFVFQASSKGNQYAPTTRLDLNVTDNHRLTGTYYWQRFKAIPDLLNNSESVFPGFPVEGHQTSYRTTGSIGLRSTLSSTMVNEMKGGWQWSPQEFFSNITSDLYAPYGGYRLNFNTITDPTTANQNNPAPRNTANYSFENTLNWQKGSHSLSFGGGFARISHEQNSRNAAPQLDFAVDTNGFDPANGMFTTANFPGASSTVLTEARNIYAILTGRVSAIPGTARLDAETGQYVYMGNLLQKSRMDSFDLYAQDQWRVSPTVTLNYGLRWDVQLPFTPVTNTWSTTTLADLCGMSGVGSGPGGRSCNLFKPGQMPAGADYQPTYTAFTPGTRSYDTDWNNFAPNLGIAWRPNVQTGWLRTMLGDPEQATIRAGYSMTYGFERMDRFTGLYGANPGGTTVASRNYGTGFPMLGPGETGPVLLREPQRLGPPAFQAAPEYPILATAANSVNLFDPNIKTPYVNQFSAGIQRSIGRDMAFEVRYVGNRNYNAWTTENWNSEETIFENGFYDEFRLAQQNLLSHVAQGCGGSGNPCTFAYRGPGTGTSPLPTYLAYFNGSANANTASAYTSTNFRNSSYLAHLSQYEPDPADAANDLHASATFRANALGAGLPANFFVMNPAIGNANITRSLAGTRYHGVQMDLRRRFSQGLLVNANYTWSRSYGSSLQTLRSDRIYLQSTDVPHSFKMQWVYEVPVGRGRRFGSDMNKWLNAVVGNWEYSGTGRVHKELYDMGSVRVVGMSMDELQDAFQIRTVRDEEGAITVFSFPQDIIDNTRRAYNTDPTSPTGYSGDGAPSGRYIAPASTPGCIAIYRGDCGAPRQVLLLGPVETRFDMRLNKRFPFGRKANVELTLEVLNVFDNINFTHTATPGGGASTFQVTGAYTDINTTADPGGRIGQIQWRVTW